MRTRLASACAALAAGLPALAGCRGYVLQGTVIEGATSDMTFVAADDPRLRRDGVANVRITVDRDPDRLSVKMVGTDLSADDGWFEIPVEGFGAGYLSESFRIRASKPGYRTADTLQRLSAGSRERYLVIILAPGHSPPDEREDLMELYERFK